MKININTLVNQEKKKFNAYYKKLLKSSLLDDELSKAMIYGSMNGQVEQNVTIMHLDVDSLTEKRQMISLYETSSLMFNLYSKMSDFFLEKKSLAFIMGGDNFMVISDSAHKENAQKFIDTIKQEMNLFLNCGIGSGVTARDAAKLATQSLDTIREIRDSGKEKPEVYELK